MNAGFRQIRNCLDGRGLVATTYQPRSKRPVREGAVEMAEQIGAVMTISGFEHVQWDELPLDPVPAICVAGERP